MARKATPRADQAAAKTRPILFTDPMVNAILSGRKTQTRRLVKPQPGDHFKSFGELPTCECHPFGFHDGERHWRSPYGKPGDRLWVKESFITGYGADDNGDLITEDDDGNELPEKVWYRATDAGTFKWLDDDGGSLERVPWKSSRFMPRRASRITLEITDVRVERLRAITEGDAEAEGVFRHIAVESLEKVFRDDRGAEALRYFRDLWNKINGKVNWDANPWVWVVSFKRIEEVAHGRQGI